MGLGFRIWGLKFRVLGVRFRAWRWVEVPDSGIPGLVVALAAVAAYWWEVGKPGKMFGWLSS